MKKLIIALTAVAAFSAPALAADMAAKAPMRAAPVAYAPSWTGCYINGGGGYGMWNQESTQYFSGAPRALAAPSQTVGGRGYFGTVGAGCDYQFGSNIVVGVFGDYDFSDINGQFGQINTNRAGTEKLSSTWAVGGRAGWLVTPGLLTYFSAGYTESTFDRTNLSAGPGIVADQYIPGTTYKGWFVGSGFEHALSFLPGLYWKSEYRFSDFDAQTIATRTIATNALTGFEYDYHKYTHSVRSSLVYRFNWGGSAVVAKY
jgi:outer membrane immunogenic protein